MRALADKLAVGLSIICAVHCLVLPLMLGLFPILASTSLHDTAFHQAMLWIVIPLSSIALGVGCRQHKDLYVIILGVLGLATLILTTLLGHSMLNLAGERAFSLAGGIVLSTGHVRNYILCRTDRCHRDFA